MLFYVEFGGQVGDKGELKGVNFFFVVEDMQKYGQVIGYIGKFVVGFLKVGDVVQVDVDEVCCVCICLNYFVMYLMYVVLCQVLGIYVLQKGLLVNDKVLCFDFLYNEVMKLEEICAVEDLVNIQICCNLLIEINIMDFEVVKVKGVMVLFGEKYDECVCVLSMGDFFIELCGGIYVSCIGDIGLFRIIFELGIVVGVCCIEVVIGEGVIVIVYVDSDCLSEVVYLLKGDSNNLVDKVCLVLECMCQLEKEL